MPKVKLEDIISDSELERLNKKKDLLQRQEEEIKKDCDKREKETAKKISQAEEALKQEVQNEYNKLEERKKELDRQEKDLAIRIKEAKDIEQMQKDLQAQSNALQDEVKSIDTERAILAEKEHKAELLIEQYNTKLKELEQISKK